VLAAHRVREQLEGAPPELRGYVDGVVAFLRVDPSAASVAFDSISSRSRGVVVLVDLVWLRAAPGPSELAVLG
jgi:hypothetical protein